MAAKRERAAILGKSVFITCPLKVQQQPSLFPSESVLQKESLFYHMPQKNYKNKISTQLLTWLTKSDITYFKKRKKAKKITGNPPKKQMIQAFLEDEK
ncbi:MAG: hypothetical protein SO170_07080 [Butyribacter sp.]|nr:hypothetical protein [Butyribacter sp.]